MMTLSFTSSFLTLLFPLEELMNTVSCSIDVCVMLCPRSRSLSLLNGNMHVWMYDDGKRTRDGADGWVACFVCFTGCYVGSW